MNVVFDYLSHAIGVGITVIDMSGRTRYASEIYRTLSDALLLLNELLDCVHTERMALLYACYQARRFGGRYIFYAPSGFTYCAVPLVKEGDEMVSGIIAGPFLMTEHDEYMQFDMENRIMSGQTDTVRTVIDRIPYKTPVEARAISELLFMCAEHRGESPDPVQTVDPGLPGYPLDKEDELLAAVSKGDEKAAGALLNEILGQILFNSGRNIDVIRSHVFELTVLLSRAAMRGGADADAILGMNYAYLQEIDALTSIEDIIGWLHIVTLRFGRHVLNSVSRGKQDVICKAIAYIKNNYMHKIMLQDMANHVYLSPTYFAKVFKDETGYTPGSFLTAIRIDIAKRLLKDISVSIADISDKVGLESQSYFTRVFKKSEGLTPGQYRHREVR